MPCVPLERLDIARSGPRKGLQLEIDLSARGSRKLAPLADRSRSELDLLHMPNIAHRDAASKHVYRKVRWSPVQDLGAMR